MKKLTLIVACAFAILNVNAIEISEPLHRVINVTGSAEMIVPPDEIELEITMTEYGGGSTIAKIETALMKLLLGNDVPKEQVVFNGTFTSFYWYYWWHHRNDSRKSKKLIVTLDAKTDFMKLVRDLDKEYISHIRIAKTSNNDIQKLRRDVKIEAIKAAKAKAKYLLEAVDEEVGRLITVDELSELNHNQHSFWNHGNTNQVMSNSVMSYSKSRGGYMENVPEIKLRYEIKTQFEIK
ncbi:MAG: SIMPL domain-containing protein [Vicingaceae bacterium]|nr:SIMPL domain-containing protein [Vicingaceae bacterium]